LIKPLKDKTLE